MSFLESDEIAYCKSLLVDLASASWLQPLLDRIKQLGGINNEAIPYLFELRFAAELQSLGLSTIYEYETGVNNTTVDFRIEDDFGSSWLVELVSINTSEAVKKATKEEQLEHGVSIQRTLLTTGCRERYGDSESEKKRWEQERKQSEECEIILVQQKIGEKVYSRGKYVKFPPISDNVYHIVLVDIKGFLGVGSPDVLDLLEIMYGGSVFKNETPQFRHFWEDEKGLASPIQGLYQSGNPLRAAKPLQERIHFVCFIEDKFSKRGEMLKCIRYCANDNLFDDYDNLIGIYEKIPFGNKDHKQLFCFKFA